MREKKNKKKQDLSHLRIFGCHVYIHIMKEKITKLEPSRKKGIFQDIVNPPKVTGFTFQDKELLKLAEILNLKKILLLINYLKTLKNETRNQQHNQKRIPQLRMFQKTMNSHIQIWKILETLRKCHYG